MELTFGNPCGHQLDNNPFISWLPCPASHLAGGSQPSPQYHSVPTGLRPQVYGLTSGPAQLSFSVLNLFGDYLVVANSYPKSHYVPQPGDLG